MTARVVAGARYVIVLGAALSGVLPLLWTLGTSFKTQVDAQSYPPQLVPAHPTLDNYAALFRTSDFVNAGITSIIVTVGATILTLLVALMCAYALVRLRVLGRGLLTLLIVLALTIPGIVFMVPLYTLALTVGLYDTHILLVFVYAGFLTPYTTLIIASFIRAIPIELEEAAVVDGASRWQVLIRIVLPLARTGIACAAIFAALDAWNEFLMPVILGGETARPLTVFVASFVTQKQIAWGPLTAAVTTVLVPVVVVVVVLQRQLVTGLTAGSLKG